MPDSGKPRTAPAYEPVKDIVAKRLLSNGGAQCRHIPYAAGYVTPLE